MRNVQLILVNTIRDLLSKKTVYFLLFATIGIAMLAGSGLSTVFSMQESTDPAALLAQKANVLSEILQLWGLFTILFAIIYSAIAMYSEKKNRSIVSILAKPIARWEFLLGKWLGVLLFFLAFLLIGILAVLVFMIIWDISFTALFWTGIMYRISEMVVFSGLAFMLSQFINMILGGGISFVFWAFGTQFQNLIDSSYWYVDWIGTIGYYLGPAQITDRIIKDGILNNVLNPDFALYWSVIGENILYAVVVFYIGAVLFTRKDIQLN
ncbi:MAG: ABC transporter permease subunit [Balneolaceae bacterium]|nr:ABC transporter permease subunit [Balneolaceae bacterium]